MKILLADDSVTMHRAVTLGLRNEPFEVITCDNGQDALRLALEKQPEIVLADLDMPGLTGLELLSAIRKESSLARVRVVLLCGSFDQVDENRLKGADADGRLWKPFEAQALVALVNTLLKQGLRESAEATEQGIQTPSASSPTAELAIEVENILEEDLEEDNDEKNNIEEDVHDESDDVRDLADETFREVTQAGIRAEEHSVRVSAEPTSLSVEAEESDDIYDEDLPSVDSRQAAETLWSEDFDPGESLLPSDENDSNINYSDNLRSKADVDYNDENSEDDFQIVTSSAWDDSEELDPPADFESNAASNQATEGPLDNNDPFNGDDNVVEIENTGNTSSIDFSTFHEEARIDEKVAAAAASALNEAEIRALIREEMKESFRTWLQKALEDELSRVIAELGGENTKDS